MRYPFLVLLSMLIGGCATGTTETISRIPVPDIPASQQAEIKVCRKHIFLADAATTITSVDREPVLRSRAGKCFSLRLFPGNHILTVTTQGVAGPKSGQLIFFLPEGATKYFDTKLERIEEMSGDEFADEFGKNYTEVTVQ